MVHFIPGLKVGVFVTHRAPNVMNKELKRRSRVSGEYSNDQSLLRAAVCIMIDINEDWITDKRYLSREE
jgi:hypothetical protein